MMHEICRSPKHRGSAYTTLPIRIAGIDQSINRESLLAGRRGYFLALHFARTCIQTMRVLVSRRTESFCAAMSALAIDDSVHRVADVANA
ncbi:hypothetical protein [Paraburkholderia sp. 32]|uniref:hypothetical protein n=1 Tax=unclassified Paraburkholderia TaxID=2615204 RepID=UPI003D1FB182